jgi:two-component system, NtrC family, sensor kinase
MTVRLRLVVIIVFVAMVPITVSALTGLRLHTRAHERGVGDLHRRTADDAAALSQAYLDGALRSLELMATETIRWDELGDEERGHALWLVYRQLAEVGAVALLDGKGDGIGQTAYQEPAAPLDELREHPLLTLADLEQFGHGIPHPQALAKGVAVGAPFAAGGGVLLPIGLRVRGTGGQTWVVAVALSMDRLCRAQLAAGAVRVRLLDGDARVLCGGSPALALAPADADLRAKLASAATRTSATGYRDDSGRTMVMALAALPVGWTAVADQPRARAFAASRRLLLQSLFWIAVSLVIALVAGVLLAQSIDRPVRALAAGTRALAAGDFGHRLPATGSDELARLAQAFNAMGGEIQRRDAEIRAWNEELQGRVEARTRELREAQAQLLEAHKLAAVSSLGAGFAHEINNPLTGVLGLTQVLRARAGKDGRTRDVELLATVEVEATRIRDIIQRVQELAQVQEGRGFTRVKVVRLLDDAAAVIADRAAAAGVAVIRQHGEGVGELMGDGPRLQHALLQLLDNALAASPAGGSITLASSQLGDNAELVKLEVKDTGAGIAPEHLTRIFEPFFTTKRSWRGQGLGLSVAFTIIQAHGGQLKVASEPGQGTTFTILLPAARRGAHLE